MREYKITAAAILAIITLGFLFLIRFGVSAVAYFGIAVIVLSIAGSLAYTWWKTQSDVTIEKLRDELLIKIRRDYVEAEKLINRAGESVDVKQILRDMEAMRHNLIKLKLYDENFERVQHLEKKYTLTMIEQESRHVEQRLRSLETLAAVDFKPHLDKRLQELSSKLNGMLAAGYKINGDVRDFAALSSHESKSLREMLDRGDAATKKFSSILSSCVDEASRLLDTGKKYGIVKTMENSVIQARENLNDFEASVNILIGVRGKMKDFLKDFFIIERDDALKSMETAYAFLKEEHMSVSRKAAVDGIVTKVKSLADSGRMGELHELVEEFKKEITAAIKELYAKQTSLEVEIKGNVLYREIWLPDPLIDSMVKRVDENSELRMFTRHAVEALEHMSKQLQKDTAFVKIVSNYDKVEPVIEKKLKEEGKVAASSLNVKYPEKFLMIYSKKHPGMELKGDTLKSVEA